MSLVPSKRLIYLNANHELPSYLETLPGYSWHFVSSSKELHELIASGAGDLEVVVRAEFLSQRALEGFAHWSESNPRVSFIFIVQTIENTAYQMSLNHPRLLFVYESDGEKIVDLLTRRLMGRPVKSRKQERQPVRSQIMIKKVCGSSAAPAAVQFLKEGQMRDFSTGGARIALPAAGVEVKDFLSLMYRNKHGHWVSVESQVRWVVATANGEQMIGVQFLALSA